jgi:hypothetical protein
MGLLVYQMAYINLSKGLITLKSSLGTAVINSYIVGTAERYKGTL